MYLATVDLNRNTGDHTLFPEPLPQNSVRNEDKSLIVTWPVSFPKERGVVSSLAKHRQTHCQSCVKPTGFTNHHRFCRARYACPCMFFSTLYHNYICTCSHLSHAHCHSFQILIMETEYRLIYTSIRYEVQFSELVVLTNVYYHQV